VWRVSLEWGVWDQVLPRAGFSPSLLLVSDTMLLVYGGCGGCCVCVVCLGVWVCVWLCVCAIYVGECGLVVCVCVCGKGDMSLCVCVHAWVRTAPTKFQ